MEFEVMSWRPLERVFFLEEVGHLDRAGAEILDELAVVPCGPQKTLDASGVSGRRHGVDGFDLGWVHVEPILVDVVAEETDARLTHECFLRRDLNVALMQTVEYPGEYVSVVLVVRVYTDVVAERGHKF